MTSDVEIGAPLTDDQCEVLRDMGDAVSVGGDSDWRVAVYLYVLAVDLVYGDTVIPAGTYMRQITGNHVAAWPVTGGDAAGYVAHIEAEYQAWDDAGNWDGYENA